MQVGDIVWHVGKNVATKEVKIEWMSPETIRNSRFQPDALVLVKRLDNPSPWSVYCLIPIRQLSETKPVKRCRAYFSLSLTNGVQCDLNQAEFPQNFPEGHIEVHHARVGETGDLYWKEPTKLTGTKLTSWED